MISAPSSFTPPSLLDLIADLRAGTVVMLSSASGGIRMTPGSMAFAALTHALTDQLASGKALLVIGDPTIDDTTVHSLLHDDAGHEVAWLSTGGLHDHLATLALNDKKWTYVVYLDPWVSNVDAQVRSLFPNAIRIRCDDSIYRKQVESSEYWEELEGWLLNRDCEITIPVGKLISLLTPDWWLSQRDRVTVADSHQSDAILIDEAFDSPPEPDLIRLVLDKYPDQRVILLTPHWGSYVEKHQALVKRCAVVMRTDDMTPSTYAAMLMRSPLYVTPHGPPFGQQALSCLARSSHAHVLVNDVPGPWCEGTVHPHRSLESLAAALSVSGRALGRTVSSPQPLHSTISRPVISTSPPPPPENLDTWFSQLSTLVNNPSTHALPLPGLTNSTASHLDNATSLCDIALLTCCYKYMQRFRIFIDSVVRQDHPLDRIEVCIAAPGNPDGVREYVAMIRQVYPALRLSVVDLPEEASSNKGRMLNAAFRASTANRIMVTDCDLVLGPSFISTILASHAPDRILGCWRTPMNPDLTAKILIGAIDPVLQFDSLRQQWDDDEIKAGVRQGLLGYCQVVMRTAFATVGYPEEFEGFGQSDIVFVDRLREQLGITGDFRKDLFVLHLSHRRDWTGTKVFL